MSKRPLIIAVVVWFVAYFAARGVLERGDLALWLRVFIATLPLIPFAFVLALFVGEVRAADELERRIHLEALAIAFPLAVVLLMTLALLQRAMPLKFEDWSYAHVWIWLPLLYVGSYSFARARYQ